MSIRIGILGYGNLGRGVECAIKHNPDMELVAVFTRRDPATVKILTDSVGSFVDAFQGIQMFGDATQVHNIVSIAAVAGIGILISVIAAFCKRVNE